MSGHTDFIPKREAELVNWSNNFAAQIDDGGVEPPFGLTAQQVTDFVALNTAWVAAYNAAVAPETRGPSTIQAKNDAKAAMVANARELARIIQAFPALTNQERVDLGLTVPDTEPTPIPPPSSTPTLTITCVLGHNVHYTLRDPAQPDKRGKPTGVAGASVFAHVGETAPADPAQWQLKGNVTRTKGTVMFSSLSVPAGSKVWLTASWFNPRGQQGPLCDPQAVYLSGAISNAA